MAKKILTFIFFIFFSMTALPSSPLSMDLSDQVESDEMLQALPIVLKENPVVNDSHIRLGDLFSGLTEEDDKKIIAPAPALGKDAILTADWLYNVAKKNKINWVPANSQITVKVFHAAKEIESPEIKKFLLSELKKYGLPENADISVQKGVFPLLVPIDSDWQFSPVKVEYNSKKQSFEVKLDLIVNGEKKQELSFAGHAQIFIPVAVAKQDLEAGTVITQDDITVRNIIQESRNRRNRAANVEDLIGKEVKRFIHGGQTISDNDIKTPVMVEKGKIVTLNFTKGNVMLSAKGKALEDGEIGETVRVMNIQSKNIIQGTVTAPSTVSISSMDGRR